MAVKIRSNKPLDLVLAFISTIHSNGHIGGVLEDDRSREEIAQLLHRLADSMPRIRIAQLAACAISSDLVKIRWLNLGTKLDVLEDFLNNIPMPTCSIGPAATNKPDAYVKTILDLLRDEMSWREDSARALVLVGDTTNPHPVAVGLVSQADDSAQLLKALGVRAYAVHFGGSSLDCGFMRHLVESSGGLHLELTELSELPDFLAAVAYRASGDSRLQFAYEREIRSRSAPREEVIGMLSLVRRASAETVLIDESAELLLDSIDETPNFPETNHATKPPKPAVRTCRESCSDRSLPERLAELAWSPWHLTVGQPAARCSTTRPAWQLFHNDANCSLRRSLLPETSAATRRRRSALAVELSVQPRNGAQRCVLYGRVIPAGRPATLSSLLTGRPDVRAQLRRVLRRGMRIFVRTADVVNPTHSLRLERLVSYAWCSGRPVRSAGVFVSVSGRSLR